MDLRPSRRPSDEVVAPEPWLRKTLLAADGVRISAVCDPWIRTGGVPTDRPTFIVSHGFTGSWSIGDNRRIASALSAHSSVISLDHRGHAESTGECTLGKDELQDLDAAVEWALWLGAPAVITVGFSMGGSIVLRHAALTAAEYKPAIVVSVSSAGFWFYQGTAPMRLLHRAVFSPVGRTLLRNGFGTRVNPTDWELPYPLDPSGAAARIAPTPLLIVHGSQDTYFPVEHAESIEAAARRGAVERGVRDSATLWVIDDFAHAESATTAELADRIGSWAIGEWARSGTQATVGEQIDTAEG